MRGAMESDDDRRQSGSRRIADDRAEILRLIDRIRRDQTETRRSSPGATSPLSTHRFSSMASADYEARIDVFEQSIMPALYGLEERLRKLESKAGSDSGPSAPAGHLLGGAVNEGILPDLLQMISSNQLSGIFVAEDAMLKVELFFHRGEMYHAISGETVGESALFAAFSLDGGRFYFLENDQPIAERTIEANTQFLILEALRQVDEKRGG